MVSINAYQISKLDFHVDLSISKAFPINVACAHVQYYYIMTKTEKLDFGILILQLMIVSIQTIGIYIYYHYCFKNKNNSAL